MFWTYLAAFVGVLLAGSLSDKFAAKSNKARMVLQAFGLIAGAVFLFVMGGSRTLWVLYLSFAGWGFFRAFFDANTGDLMETYLSKGSTGGCNNYMIGLSRMMSLSARAGVSIDDIVDQLVAYRKKLKMTQMLGALMPERTALLPNSRVEGRV